MTDSTEHLQELHSALASDLLARIQSGEATAQELSVAVKFLKEMFPNMKIDEVELLARISTTKELKELAEQHGMDKKDVKV